MNIAKVCVSSAVFSIDKPYKYLIPDDLLVQPGMRITIPFGRANHVAEGVVLAVEKIIPDAKLKNVLSVLDTEPFFSEEQIKLAIWMNDRFFCTVFEALKAMVPSGMWFKNGKPVVSGKVLTYVDLNVSPEDIENLIRKKSSRAPVQAEGLRFLSENGRTSTSELYYYTGATNATVSALVKQGIVVLSKEEIYRQPEYSEYSVNTEFELTDAQQKAYGGIESMLETGKPGCALLYGVTGSGKTNIYISLIRRCLELNKTALIMVPEISLTPQLMKIIKAHFGDRAALLHSALSVGERADEWKRIKRGLAKVVLGTRSAVFAPLDNLGLIIADEEQSSSYKSESAPRYHAVDVAKYRCAHENALLLLGSATPSVETMYKAANGSYRLFTITERYHNSLPKVIISDMRPELRNGSSSLIGTRLASEIRENLDKGEQTILFLNRRGTYSRVICSECGETVKCGSCSVPMKYHSANDRFMCHYCGKSIKKSNKCPACGAELKYIGMGTQLLEKEIRRMFPNINVLRMDADSVNLANGHEKIFSEFKRENVPILIGTQMVAKGLDFENVTLVGVISSDDGLDSGDYRSSEEIFSMLTQVVGRSGRGSAVGRAVLQTYNADNQLLQLAANQDYKTFYKNEIKIRKSFGFPPFSDMISITASSSSESKAIKACSRIKEMMDEYLMKDAVRIFGPAPCPVVKVNNLFKYRVIFSGRNNKNNRNIIAFIIKTIMKEISGVSLFADTNVYE